MTTKQTDAVAMTEEQLDTVAGGSAFVKLGDIQGGIMRKGSSVSISPIPTPIPKVLSRRVRMGVIWPDF
jgi:hypothetical protein